jgi:hypothetical protein
VHAGCTIPLLQRSRQSPGMTRGVTGPVKRFSTQTAELLPGQDGPPGQRWVGLSQCWPTSHTHLLSDRSVPGYVAMWRQERALWYGSARQRRSL